MSRGKKLALGIILVLAVALLTGIVVVYPYWQLPPDDPKVLEAKLAEYKETADKIANRPKDDRETYEALDEALRPGFSEKGDLSKLIRQDSCPPYNLEDFPKVEEALTTVLSQDERVHKLAEGGLVMRHGRYPKDDMPNFFWLRQVAYAYTADAVLKTREGDTAAATDQILAVAPLGDGCLNTPVLLYVMLGVAVNGILDQGIVSILPLLSDADLARLRDVLLRRPKAAKAVVDGMATELVRMTDLIDSLARKEDYLKEAEKLVGHSDKLKMSPLEWTMLNILGPLGYLKRERVKVLAFGVSQVERYRSWLTSGATEAPQTPISLVQEPIQRSVFLSLGWPNYDKLVNKGREMDLRTTAVLEAIEREKMMRATGTRERLELPYDDERKIVIEKDFGCIMKSEKVE